MTRPVDQLQPNEAAIALLFDNLAALPHEEYGVINMLPFSHDSEQVRIVKRHVCEAIVNLLESNGFISGDRPQVEPVVHRVAIVKCRKGCDSEMLISFSVSDHGMAYVDAAQFISAVSQLNPRCPHTALTLEDMRTHMEREFWAGTCVGCNVETSDLQDGLCVQCVKERGHGK